MHLLCKYMSLRNPLPPVACNGLHCKQKLLKPWLMLHETIYSNFFCLQGEFIIGKLVSKEHRQSDSNMCLVLYKNLHLYSASVFPLFICDLYINQSMCWAHWKVAKQNKQTKRRIWWDREKRETSFKIKQDGSCLSVLAVVPFEMENKMPSCVPFMCAALGFCSLYMQTLIQTHAGRGWLWFQSSDSGL